ncbi:MULTISPECIES: GNAT family N-acetyltransferase [unclassified Roseateles]|uniref:GNAT family N-acetyltransferase n=1 Tax=unclassified Roseateles TaxID=2626991 RepID=UPI0007023472|nr:MULTISPECIES: GNAT family protein [unclassified Roseateles]KQW51985.1 GCN5 family acetyltransferase [Pelomonas sp. Root405]KRA78219.1 GCN5 family acetyltransferase [Pelomonas sp. Root662]
MNQALRPVGPVTLAAGPIRLVPLTLAHAPGLQSAAADGQLWNLRFTSVPAPDETQAYIETALAGQAAGHRLPFAVLDAASGEVLGSTSFHDIVSAVARVEIGYTWYAQRVQRSAVNTTAKLLMLTHAFETLGAQLVGWRTDNFNHASQRAIERLGAKRDGVLRHHALRRDGTVRDTVMYSLTVGEWPEVRAHLNWQLTRQRP